jgi:hypothetical protein
MLKKIGLILFICWHFNAIAYESSVSPIFIYGKWENLKYYTNLEESKDNFTLDLKEHHAGYIINTKRVIGLSAGLETALNSIPLTVGIGLAPANKTYASFINHVDSLDEAEKMLQFIPVTVNQLDQYKINDSATFELIGGVIFRIGAELEVLNIGEKFIRAGGWSCYVKKVSDDTIYVELKKIREIGKSIYSNLIIPYYEAGKIKDIGNGFSYLINYKSEAGLVAYHAFLKGQLDLINPIEKKITEIKTINYIKEATYKNFGYYIPFVPLLSYINTKETTSNNEDSLIIGSEEMNHQFDISLHRKNLNLLGYRKLIDTAFLINSDENNSQMQFYFKHVTNLTRVNKLNSIKELLMNLTGLSEFLDFKLNELDNVKLGFAQIQLAVRLGNKLVNAIKSQSTELINFYENKKFENDQDNKNIKKFINSLKISKFKYSQLAEAGQVFWSSPKLFQTQLELIKLCGGEISYEVSGKKISRLIRKKEFIQSIECPLH